MIPVANPGMSAAEADAVARVVLSGHLVQGEQVAEFERQFAAVCGVRYALAVSSGTAALHLALIAHGIGPGDEVITTGFSFAATANTILLVGATPVFVDIEPDTYTIDPACVEAAITSRTKAIMPVHLYGHPADMTRLQQIARQRQLVLIEDACQAHYAAVDGKVVGSFGTGCFSFYATKNMTTGEGGIVTTDDPEIAERVQLLRSHGQAARYHHVTNGYNFRMTDLQAVIGLVQIEKLVRLTEQRIANADYLTQQLGPYLQTPVVRPGCRHVFHQYTVRVPAHRDDWAAALRERGVGTGVHYPCPIYRQPYYQSLGFDLALAQTDAAADQVLCLPVHPSLTSEELETVAREVIALCR